MRFAKRLEERKKISHDSKVQQPFISQADACNMGGRSGPPHSAGQAAATSSYFFIFITTSDQAEFKKRHRRRFFEDPPNTEDFKIYCKQFQITFQK